MISTVPSLFDRSLSRSGTGIDAFVDRHADEAVAIEYGSGKVALRDGLAGVVEPGENVLVPAYLSPAVVEPFHELGLESRFYAMQDTLAPDGADLEARIDDDTVAVMSVNYFGFPQPDLELIASLADTYDLYHIDDNAHSPLSVHEGRLLGTSGDLGITSLRKLLPVPDGALLYCTDGTVTAECSPSSLAGRSDRFTARDWRFVATSAAGAVLERSPALYRSVERAVSDGDGSSAAEPGDRYEAAKVPMSKLSTLVIDTADPAAIRTARRENYLAWKRVLSARDDVTMYYERLPAGISPYGVPIRASEPASFLAELEDCGVVGAHTWPTLRRRVREDETYEIARTLAAELVVLPVHQGIEPSAIERVGTRLRR
ncbi:DegT/DnrJ/EryC1/StrS family aminotransferase [Natrinema ejinorense]|uniref:Aminotransferase DegT n=1 Tax=Natrinema ejinorense TaxID=373386 RepID=A0A2A5R019_9EURY|nr:DegT/DnrJ/EryC1/StrS family aminotransferase [Natrinema ejinorense]PCR92402.1 aminotransferase DegT [Natrinema ejinorense]